MKRRLRPGFAAAVVLTVAAIAAGCGGSTRHQAGGIGEGGAAQVRSGALAYVAIDSDLGSSQWQQVDSLLKKFPIRDRFFGELRHALADKNLDYNRDVKPALGPEVDVVVAIGSSPRDISYAALTKPDSVEKAKELVQKLDQGSPPPSATRVVDGWFFVADKQEMIDNVLKGSGSALADDSHFADAMSKLPSDALVKAYANGRQLANIVGSLFGGAALTAAGGTSPFGLDTLDWLAAAVVAKDNGLELEGDVKSTPDAPPHAPPYSSKLLSGVPADAFAFLTFRGPRTNPIAQYRSNPQFRGALEQIEKELGMRLEDVFALFEHEVAFYVRRGPGLPEFSLVLEEPDTQRALTTLDRLASRVTRLVPARLGSETEAGLTVKTLNFGPVTVRWAGFDGRVLLTTSPTGISDYRAGGDKLADTSAYKNALSTAGAPDQTNGLLYLNLADVGQLIQSYAGLAGTKVPPDVAENLKPLRSFVAYATANGDLEKSTAFLEVK
jgi:hypothetical protein